MAGHKAFWESGDFQFFTLNETEEESNGITSTETLKNSVWWHTPCDFQHTTWEEFQTLSDAQNSIHPWFFNYVIKLSKY